MSRTRESVFDELSAKDVYVREIHLRLIDGEVVLIGDFPDTDTAAPRWVELVIGGVSSVRVDAHGDSKAGFIRVGSGAGTGDLVLEIHGAAGSVAAVVIERWTTVRCDVSRRPPGSRREKNH